MAKLEISKARAFANLRERKIHDALSTVRVSLSAQKAKLVYALHFWNGPEGVAWFMKKNELDAMQFEREFDEACIIPFVEREITVLQAEKIAALEQKFLSDLADIVCAEQ